MQIRLTALNSTRSYLRKLVLCLLLTLLSALCIDLGLARAEAPPELRIIVHPDNPSGGLEREFLSDVYLKRTTRWGDGETIRPVDQRADSAVRHSFSEHVLQRSVAAVKRYWQQRIFSGRDLPPPELESDEAVIEYVVKHHGAIGYVSGGAKLGRAKSVPIR